MVANARPTNVINGDGDKKPVQKRLPLSGVSVDTVLEF